MPDSVLVRTYLEHELELLRFLGKRLGSPSIAADIAQDLYLKLLRVEDPEPIRDRRAYVFGMAANLATDHLRVEKRRSEIRAEAEGVIWHRYDELTPERHAMARDELDHMKAVIARLDERCRQVFFLSRYEGKSQAQIAAELGIGVTTVYKDLKKVMSALLVARRQFHGQKNDDEGH